MEILKKFIVRFSATAFILSILCFVLPLNVLGQFRLTIKLVLPPSNHSNPNEQYFLTSEYNKWLPADSGYRFKKINGVYQLSFLYNSKYWLQYKITRGTKEGEESDTEGYGISNRMLNVTSDTTINVIVAGWKDLIIKKHTRLKNVKILSNNFPMKSLNRTRQIWIYLPASYNKNKKRFPVVYMQDGSELFDRAATDDGNEWRLDEKLDSLYKKNKIEVIVVGIASDEHRDSEYAPYPTKKRPHPEGVQYLNFLSKELVPYIDRHYRTKIGPENTAIGGSSMGGLISLYAILHYNNVFGAAAIFSPAYWNSAPVDTIKNDILKNNPKLHAKIFLYGGDREGVSTLPATLTEFKNLFSDNSNNSVKIEIFHEGLHRIPFWTEPFSEFVKWITASPKKTGTVGKNILQKVGN